jgi:hypothetical protein
MDYTEAFVAAFLSHLTKEASEETDKKKDRRVQRAMRGAGVAIGGGIGLHRAYRGKWTAGKGKAKGSFAPGNGNPVRSTIGGAIIGGVAGHLAGKLTRHGRELSR